jgi:hypothetical protein
VSRRYTRSFDKNRTLSVCPEDRAAATRPPRNSDEKCKSVPFTGLDRPRGFQEAEAPKFQDNRHMQVVRLSAPCTGRLYPRGNIPGTHFLQRLCRTQSHRIMSKKNSNDITCNRTRNLPACSAVPHPTAPRRAPTKHMNSSINSS